MKFVDFARLYPRRVYIRIFVSALALSAVIMGIGFTGRSATINREKLPWERRVILSGIVRDSMCGAGNTINGHGDRECTRICVKLGANYALMANKSLFILKGHESELDEYAGEKVIVAGAVSGNIVRVESIAPVRLLHSTASFEGEF